MSNVENISFLFAITLSIEEVNHPENIIEDEDVDYDVEVIIMFVTCTFL